MHSVLHTVVTLGFIPNDDNLLRNVAIVILKVLNYKNVEELFAEDESDERVAQNSLLLLELLTLVLEHWTTASTYKD